MSKARAPSPAVFVLLSLFFCLCSSACPPSLGARAVAAQGPGGSSGPGGRSRARSAQMGGVRGAARVLAEAQRELEHRRAEEARLGVSGAATVWWLDTLAGAEAGEAGEAGDMWVRVA